MSARRIVGDIVAAMLSVSVSVAVTYIAGRWAVRAAHRCRGYEAVGGEYLFIAIVFMVSLGSVWKASRHGKRALGKLPERPIR